MQIVPENDALIAEARVRPIDVDQVRVGQPARLRFSNLSQRTTPEIDGHVIRVSADAVKDERVDQPYYIVRLRFDRGSIPGEAVLLPGMPVEVFIRTDPRSLASYLVKPMADQMRRAFREK
jgi:HlyD family secretion protein